jgi:GAF domain-containing protein
MKLHRPVSGRELKKILAALLVDDGFPASLDLVRHVRGRQVVNPLFAFFCDADTLRRWRAVSVMGRVVSRLADENLESARVVMRRFMWNLNEESGGIGWGCPEAMGECMARSDRLANEYGCILWSYLHPERNFIEHPALQEGVLWGVARLTHARPAQMTECAELLKPFLQSPEAALRGLAAWAGGPLADARLTPLLQEMQADRASLQLYRRERLAACSVGELAVQALRWTPAGSMEKDPLHGMES